MRKIIGVLILLILFIALNAIASNQDAPADHSVYAKLLRKHVKTESLATRALKMMRQGLMNI